MLHGKAGQALAWGLLGTAFALAPPRGDDLGQFAAWAARPTLLPFAWHGLVEAERGGDAVEAFARAQNVMRLLPSWADGFCAFAFRYALTAESVPIADPAERGARAKARLELAMAWLATARPLAGRHEPAVLQALAFLPEVAVRNEPALAAQLRSQGGAAVIADRWFAELEQRFPHAALREQRTFFAPVLAGALLTAGNRDAALGVLQTAIQRSFDVRDQELATEWRQRLQEVVRWLQGDRTVDLAAVRDDTRMEPLLPHLR